MKLKLVCSIPFLIFTCVLIYPVNGQCSRLLVLVKPDMEIKNISSPVKWPHSGTFNIEMAIHYGDNMAGSGVKTLVEREDQYFETLNSEILLLPANSYVYMDDFMFFGFKVLYFMEDKFGAGIHYFNCSYSQELTLFETVGSGDLLNLNYVGSSFTYFIYRKQRFGISTKSDLSFVTGNFSSVPALTDLADKGAFDHINGIADMVRNRNMEATFTGYHASASLVANWLFARWFSLDTGVSLNYLNGKLNNPVWPGTATNFNSIRPGFHIGFSFYLFNNQD